VIKTVVSIELDLAASRAIRFASQLNYFVPMEILPVYVKALPPRDLSIGSGWVRRHWEQELVQEGKAEIIEMISSEWEFSPTLKEPLVAYGDRERELLKIMEADGFDVFVDGEPLEWTPANLYYKVHSKLWHRFPGVIGVARVLRRINQLLILCTDPVGVGPLTQSMAHLWARGSLPVTLAVPHKAPEALAREAARGEEVLAQAGCQVSLFQDFPYYPEPPTSGYLREYGLVAVALPRGLKKDSPQLAWLSQVRVPLLIKLY